MSNKFFVQLSEILCDTLCNSYFTESHRENIEFLKDKFKFSCKHYLKTVIT